MQIKCIIVQYFRSFYYEQRYVTKNPATKEEFVCAIALCKMTAVNMNVKEMMNLRFGVKKIELNPQVIERD